MLTASSLMLVCRVFLMSLQREYGGMGWYIYVCLTMDPWLL